MRHFIQIDDFSAAELKEILERARKIKKNPQYYKNKLSGKTLGLIFEKPSTRTRISFQVGMSQLGGSSLYLAPNEIQLGEREEIKDVARTMSRFLDVVVMRTYSHLTLTEFAEYAMIPVVNGLTDYTHPAQAMADYMTIEERFEDLSRIKFAYIGDGNNVLNSLLFLFSRLGISMSVATPMGFEPNEEVLRKAYDHANASGASLDVTHDVKEAVKDADVIYTDVFISMGEESIREEKVQAFKGFQINSELLRECSKNPYIMHCLPAHRDEEITDEVIEGERSIVFDQAENRLHAQKGMLHWLLSKK